jgi:UDP-N-acetylmuramate dehydrogenase
MAIDIDYDVPLAPRTTLGIGGLARRFVRIWEAVELAEALASADALGEPVLVLGGGSNLVISDQGWPGLVIAIDMFEIAIQGYTDRGAFAIVNVGAGVSWDTFVAKMVDTGFAGIECMSGIPGRVGATPMQNVGAYGQEVSDTITRVRAFDRETREVVDLAPEDCHFAYRSSMFKGNDRWIILEVAFRLARQPTSMPLRYPELARALGIEEGGTASLADVRRTVIELRRRKGMVVDPNDPDSRSAGSFFMNPILDDDALVKVKARLPPGTVMPMFPAGNGMTKLSAGWLIEQAGFTKGMARGNAGISTKHALALVNRGGATAGELMALAREIQDGVRSKLGVELQPEPVIV